MQTLKQTVRGPQVKLLQRLLNIKRRARVLAEDGVFGSLTNREVTAFQAGNGLKVDGVVGPNTWRALGVTIDINNRVVMFPQPTNMTCWSAAATMLFGNMSIGPGSATTSPNGGLGSGFENIAAFARGLGLTMHAPMSWTVQGLAGLLRRGPIWVGGVQPLGAPTAAQSGHAVVVGSMWGNGNADGTMILIYDPWPPGIGATYGAFYGDHIGGAPMMTMYVLHR